MTVGGATRRIHICVYNVCMYMSMFRAKSLRVDEGFFCQPIKNLLSHDQIYCRIGDLSTATVHI